MCLHVGCPLISRTTFSFSALSQLPCSNWLNSACVAVLMQEWQLTKSRHATCGITMKELAEFLPPFLHADQSQGAPFVADVQHALLQM